MTKGQEEDKRTRRRKEDKLQEEDKRKRRGQEGDRWT